MFQLYTVSYNFWLWLHHFYELILLTVKLDVTSGVDHCDITDRIHSSWFDSRLGLQIPSEGGEAWQNGGLVGWHFCLIIGKGCFDFIDFPGFLHIFINKTLVWYRNPWGFFHFFVGIIEQKPAWQVVSEVGESDVSPTLTVTAGRCNRFFVFPLIKDHPETNQAGMMA